jgi:hypothetical protein
MKGQTKVKGQTEYPNNDVVTSPSSSHDLEIGDRKRQDQPSTSTSSSAVAISQELIVDKNDDNYRLFLFSIS